MLEAKLVVVGGDAKSTEVKLKLPTVIGRGKEAGLTVPHALVSRRHTEIFEREGKLVVRDLGSLNGTFVNNQKIEGEQVLEPNQLLTLGNITFRAVYELGEMTHRDPDTVSFEAAATVEEPHPSNKPDQNISDIVSFSDKGSFSNVGELQVDANNKGAKSVNAQKPTDPSKINAELPELDSAIFNLDPDKPADSPAVSASALEQQLGKDNTPEVSSIDLGDAAVPQKPDLSSFEIDLGDNKPAQRDIDSDRLGSFMKKLPR